MSHSTLVVFLLQMGALLLVALACGAGARRLGQPAVFGEFIGGILVGPTVLGALAPRSFEWLFPATGAASIGREAVIKLGLLFFLFVAGRETDLSQLRGRGWSTALTSLFGIVVPFAIGYGSVLLWPERWDPGHIQGLHDMALFAGTALSISALPVIARILLDLGLLKRAFGSLVIASATFDDLLGWSLFAVIAGQAGGRAVTPARLGLLLAILVPTLVAGRWAGKRVVRWLRTSLPWPSGFIGVSALLVFAGAAAFQALGIHAGLGAFVVGVLLAPSPEERRADETIGEFVTNFFGAPIYFASVGLRADFAQSFDLVLVVLVLAVACVGKIAGATLGALLGGVPRREALAVGFAMNARGAMEVILAQVALEHRLIDQRVFVALVVMALATSLLSATAVQRLLGGPKARAGGERDG